MRHFFLIIIFSIYTMQFLRAQSPAIVWSKCYGGSSYEQAHSVVSTTDGGYIIAGNTSSNDSQVTGYHFGMCGIYACHDYWVVKTDSVGNLQWQKTLGGTAEDIAYSIIQTADGGYIVAGCTGSNDGDITGNHSNGNGSGDAWVVKLDNAGNIIWKKCYGGTYDECATDIQQTSDGGYIFSGTASSNDGDVNGFHGTVNIYIYDYWIVKIDSIGNLQWQKCLGGTGDDQAWSIRQVADSGYVVAGFSYSFDGDVVGNHGDDFWIVKMGTTGTIIWQKCLGGSAGDEANSLEITSDGGFVIAGLTGSNDFDVSGNHGLGDYWIVKTDSNSNIQHQRCLGGSAHEYALSVIQDFDGGYIVGGGSQSNDGDVAGGGGNWIVKLDTGFNISWQESFGYLGSGEGYVKQTTDSGYIVAGFNWGGFGNHGLGDFWLVKLGPSPVNINSPLAQISEFTIYYSPINEIVYLSFYANEIAKADVKIFDVMGRLLFSQLNLVAPALTKLQMRAGKLSPGVYIVSVTSAGGSFSTKLLVE